MRNLNPDFIVGPGAVGLSLALLLRVAGQRLPTLVARPGPHPALEAAKTLSGIPWPGSLARAIERPPLLAGLPDAFPANSRLWLCVKATDLPGLLAELTPRLDASTTVITTTAGVDAPRLARVALPYARVVACSVVHSARLAGPADVRVTTRPHFVFAAVDQEGGHPPWSELFTVLPRVIVETHADEDAVLWGKLLINLGSGLGAACRASFHDLLTMPELRRCYAALIEETLSILDVVGQKARLPLPLSARAYALALRHGGPLPWTMARLGTGLTTDAYPAMVADRVAGRPTEIHAIQGAVLEAATRAGRPAPANRRLLELIEGLERDGGFVPPRALPGLLGI